MRRPTFTAVTVATAVTFLTAVCGSASTAGAASSGTGAGDQQALKGTITVFAAASLTESFTELGTRFEAAHPGTTVTFSFGPGSTLATQIVQGAPVDVFAAATPAHMDQVVKAGEATAPTTFARNVLEIAVPPTNPGKVTGLNDLAKPSVKVALCVDTIPCGFLATKIFTKAGITVTPVSLERDVKAELTKVQLGEVDAGLVYVTDVRSAGGKVTGIPIPAELNEATRFPIAPLTNAANPALASAFVTYVLSAEGQQTLAAAGFAAP